MNRIKTLEESLREAACVGDVDGIELLLTRGINVNAKHDINGWTPLHWAAKRGHTSAVTLLLVHGADKNAVTSRGETPSAVCTNPEIRQLLGDSGITVASRTGPALPITPNYLQNPPLNAKVDFGETVLPRKSPNMDSTSLRTSVTVTSGSSPQVKNDVTSSNQDEELVLKVRVANCGDPDFIEIELPRVDLTYSRLLRSCCEELGVTPTQVFRVRKLPDTIVRKDKDVQRLVDFQEIEIVVASVGNVSAAGMNGAIVNKYQSISLNKNQTILY